MFSRGRPRPYLAPAMPICNPVDLKAMIKKGERLLGLDVGTKTIGMALSDTTLLLATPLDTIRRTRFRDDAKRLLEQADLPLAFWDERLSTAAVEREMIAADLSRKRRSQIIDKVAAAYILQGLLDRLRAGGA